MVKDNRNIHFIGIGGIGMSGIARILLEMGHKVSGSDIESNDLTRNIENLGAEVFCGHRSSNISKDVDLCVYSTSVSKDNPELIRARKRSIKIIHRAEMLGEIFNEKKGIAVTGTHGKTTTTSLISIVLEKAGLDPTVIIGGEVSQFGGNAKLGNGSYVVAEADESDGSFMHLEPFYAVITNIEPEHLDHYKDLGQIKSSFLSFIRKTKRRGAVFYNKDDAVCGEIVRSSGRRCHSYGLSEEADIYPKDIKMNGFRTVFTCVYKKKNMGEIILNIPGTHNVSNSLAAILVSLNLGIKFNIIAEALKCFNGAKRRFQLRSQTGDVMLIDDYAHHPTEIRAVLDTCRNWKNKRVIAVFQPHRYTRTKFLADDFGKCFSGCNKVILTDIYSASEKAIRGVSIKTIYDRIIDNGTKDVIMIKKNRIPEYIMKIKRPGDMILILGAGDIKKVADELAGRMCKNNGRSLDNYHGTDNGWIEELKGLVEGKITIGEKIASHTYFKIGGRADVWAEPRDAKDLANILALVKRRRVPLFLIGNGSNILVSDDGFRGLVVRLGSAYFQKLKIGGRIVKVGAGFSLQKLVGICCNKGLGGLESLVGIPASVGGAILMNAGGSTNPIFKNIGDLVRSLKVMDRNGKIKTLEKKDIGFAYRSSSLRPYIILEAELKLESNDKDILVSRRSKFFKIKNEKQVLDMPSAGCIFKNPYDFQFTCGQMIDMLGLKGRRIGRARISEKHGNFIVNEGGAACSNVMSLINLIKRKVSENYSIDLELEIDII